MVHQSPTATDHKHAPPGAFRPGLLKGKSAFIAGGSSGINLGIAQYLAEYGASVYLVSRSEERVQSAVSSITERGYPALGSAADVRDYEAIASSLEQAAAAFGPLEIVISGAAGNFVAPAIGMTSNGFKAVVDIDLVGTFNVFHASYEHLVKPGASLIAISAPQSKHPYAYQAHVNAAKAGVDMLTRTLALEWGRDGIRVNGIIPGPIEGTEGLARLSPDERSRQRINSTVPLGRLGNVSDVAQVALFLCSPAAAYVSGAIIPCDGGILLVGGGGLTSPLGHST
jgi:NAD(P)-dependent dehydrogenase (short-subunit alcohol dehydrogenase family)